MNKVFVIGIGPGDRDYVLPIALKAINSCDVIVGGYRNLEAFPEFSGEKMPLPKRLEEIIIYLQENSKEKRIGVIVSGDSGFYSVLGFLNRYFDKDYLEVIPGISSFQYLFSKVKIPWQDFSLLSLHGKSIDFIDKLKATGKVALLTDSIFSPEKLADILISEGFDRAIMIVGENLSYPEERIISGVPAIIKKASPYQMNVVVIINE